MSRPLLLDLYCGAGGAAMGYHQAGFDVVGIDLAPQPRYPFGHLQGDALVLGAELLATGRFAAVHASPPCQPDSAMTVCRPGLAEQYERLIPATRELLQASGLPYVIENVPGADLREPVELCGFMFGLELYRHRLFETNFALPAPAHPEHTVMGSAAGHWKPGTIISVAGNCAPIRVAERAMGISWMRRGELTEAIPPAYAQYVGCQLKAALAVAA